MYVYIIGQSFFIWYMFIYLANLFLHCIDMVHALPGGVPRATKRSAAGMANCFG